MLPTDTMQLDHLVINTRFDMDASADLFEKLGFTLTPRGFHSMGSINHLMMFDGHYLELIGLPPDGKTVREEIVNSPLGLDGLVLRSEDADQTYAHLRENGLDAQPVQLLTRPLDLDGEQKTAAFRTVRMPGEFAAGRVYYCQHLTPELVWRAQWLQHANGVLGIASMHVIDSGDPVQRRRYAALNALSGSGVPAADQFTLHFVSRKAFDAEFGALAAVVAKRADSFGAMTFRCDDAQAIAERASALGLPVSVKERRALVAVPALEMLMEFVC